MQKQPCEECEGKGKVKELCMISGQTWEGHICYKCEGTGYELNTYYVNVMQMDGPLFLDHELYNSVEKAVKSFYSKDYKIMKLVKTIEVTI